MDDAACTEWADVGDFDQDELNEAIAAATGKISESLQSIQSGKKLSPVSFKSGEYVYVVAMGNNDEGMGK